MAVFDVSFANPGTAKSSANDYGYLVDRLEIMEASLSADGKLSPGDYDSLAAEAQKIYSFPGFTPAQRSNIEVKMANYRSSKSKTKLKDQEDIPRLNREVQDDLRKSSMLLGNNPTAFLQSQVAVQNAKLEQLSTAINDLDSAGDDSTSHINEFNAALAEYQDLLGALDYVKSHLPGSTPASGFAAYVTTNASGEIINVEIAREGTNSGYLETNGLYGGLKIYGKLNRKENGQNIFVLGSDTYRGNDFVSIDPATGGVKSAPLLADRTTGGRAYGAIRTTDSYIEMDPATTKTQSAVRPGGWVEGDKGFLYQRGEDGKYTKYVNATKEQLGIKDTDIIRVPRSYENTITPMVSKTLDGAPSTELPEMGAGASFSPQTTSLSATSSQPRLPGLGGGPPPQPTSRAPQQAQGLAQRAVQGATGFLGRLFGGGQ